MYSPRGSFRKVTSFPAPNLSPERVALVHKSARRWLGYSLRWAHDIPGHSAARPSRVVVRHYPFILPIPFTGDNTILGQAGVLVGVRSTVPPYPHGWYFPSWVTSLLGLVWSVSFPSRVALHILSDNDLKFDWNAVQDFAHRFNIQWKCTSTYNPRGKGIAERIVGTLKKALQAVTRSESKE